MMATLHGLWRASDIEELAATTEEQGRSEQPTGVRMGCLVIFGLMLLGAALAILAVLVWPSGGGPIDLGNIEGYRPGSVVYRSTDGLFVVRQPDGTVLALSDLDPHNPPGRASCRVTFRPDLAQTGEVGRFYDGCTGATYDLGGHGLAGDGLDLKELPVQQNKDGDMQVKPAR
jgi:hypothetical protein